MRAREIGRRGFVTSEFYRAIAVIGVLAAIAIPAYFDYSTRARISEGLVVVAVARDAVAKAFEAGGPADMSKPAITGWSPPVPTGNVAGVSIARSGTVTVLYSGEAASRQ